MKGNLRQYSIFYKTVAIIIAVVCLVGTATFVYGAIKKDITISDNGTEKSITTFKFTVNDVLQEKDIKLKPFDKINIELDEKLKDNMSIVIKRANMITIETSEVSKYMFTTATDVKTVLDDVGIHIGELDRVEPSLDTLIAGDTTVKVTRISEELVSELVELAFKNEIIKNENMDKGRIVVKQKGEAGQKQVNTKIIYEDGTEVDRKIVDEKILKEAIDGVIEEGTKTTFTTSRGQTVRFTKSMNMSATAYDATYESCGKYPDDPLYGITYSGLRVRPGIVAVDPRVIPLGTYLYVEGYGEALAADIGGAIKGNKIDLYFESPADVKKFGRRKLKVYVLDKPRYKF